MPLGRQVWDFVGLFLISWDVLYIPFEAGAQGGFERFIDLQLVDAYGFSSAMSDYQRVL